jgi:hypothetical protein
MKIQVSTLVGAGAGGVIVASSFGALPLEGRRPGRDAVLGPVCVLQRLGCRRGGSGRGFLVVECRLLLLGRKSRRLVWDAALRPVCGVVLYRFSVSFPY